MKTHNQKFLQKRKLVMVLPLITMPFLTMIFWALGGGQGTAAHTMENEKTGLNLDLPTAQFKNDKNDWDKLSLYQKAQRDSIRFNEARRTDPYFKLPNMTSKTDTVKGEGDINTSLGTKDHSIDANTERVNKKLAELYKTLEAPADDQRKPRYDSGDPTREKILGNDVERLEGMMQIMQSGDGSEKEMKEIQSVLDKILDIQHPELVKEKIREHSILNPQKTYAVQAVSNDVVSIMNSHGDQLDTSHQREINAFYGMTEFNEDNKTAKAIQAVIHDEQSLVSGSIVQLRLSQNVYINGNLISAGQLVYGVCALNGERLTIDVASIQFGDVILPVSLSAYDLDGLEGLYIPGAIARDVAKQSSNQALHDIQLNSLNPSLEIQAASTGIETVKSLISKKSRLIKVSVKAGYKVLLVDSKDNR